MLSVPAVTMTPRSFARFSSRHRARTARSLSGKVTRVSRTTDRLRSSQSTMPLVHHRPSPTRRRRSPRAGLPGEEHVDQLVIQTAGVLDRVGARFQGQPCCGPAGMRRHPDAQPMCFIHRCFDLFPGEIRRLLLERMAGIGPDPRAVDHHELDVVGACFNLPADHAPESRTVEEEGLGWTESCSRRNPQTSRVDPRTQK